MFFIECLLAGRLPLMTNVKVAGRLRLMTNVKVTVRHYWCQNFRTHCLSHLMIVFHLKKSIHCYVATNRVNASIELSKHTPVDTRGTPPACRGKLKE